MITFLYYLLFALIVLLGFLIGFLLGVKDCKKRFDLPKGACGVDVDGKFIYP